jgi:hypothetical protein
MKSIRYSCQILMKLEYFRHIFEKYSNTKLLENPSSESRVPPQGRTERQTGRETESDRRKLIVAFRNFANAPKSRWRFEAIT